MNHLQVLIDHQNWRQGKTKHSTHTPAEIGAAMDACIAEMVTARKCAVTMAGRLHRIENGLADASRFTYPGDQP